MTLISQCGPSPNNPQQNGRPFSFFFFFLNYDDKRVVNLIGGKWGLKEKKKKKQREMNNLKQNDNKWT